MRVSLYYKCLQSRHLATSPLHPDTAENPPLILEPSRSGAILHEVNSKIKVQSFDLLRCGDNGMVKPAQDVQQGREMLDKCQFRHCG